MLYVLLQNNLPVHVTTEYPYTGTPKTKEFPGITYDKVQSRHDWKSFSEVQNIARRLTAMTGKTFLAVDNGASRSPRFDVTEPPKVGDEVSYAFNGDYYPCGTVIRVTKAWMIVTSTGKKFNRRKDSANWTMVGGTWSLVAGHIDERNPSV